MDILTGIWIQLHAIHIEYIITIVSAILIWLRLAPIAGNLKVLVYALQAGLFIAQMYQVYKKQKEAKNIQAAPPKEFVAELAAHYLQTHPDGKKIAIETEIDEELEESILKSDGEVVGLG